MEPISPRDPQWRELLEQRPAYSPFARPEWTYLLERYLEGYTAASFRVSHGSGVWILPGLLHKKPLGQHSFLSLPFGTHGGLVGAEPPPPELLAAFLPELVKTVGPWITVTTDPWAPLPPPPGFRERRVETHRLDLTPGFTQLWEHRFSAVLRRKVRRAERLEVLFRPTTGKQVLGDFLSLWDDMQRGKGLRLPFGPDFFAALFSQPWCRLYATILRDRVLAVAVVLLGKRQAHAWQGVVDRTAGDLNPNRMLIARVIEALCAEGIEKLDLGSSEGQAGLSQFKEAFGALPTSVTQWRHTPAWALWARS